MIIFANVFSYHRARYYQHTLNSLPIPNSVSSRRDPAFPIPGIPAILNFPFPVRKLAGSRFPTFLHFLKVLCYCEVFCEENGSKFSMQPKKIYEFQSLGQG